MLTNTELQCNVSITCNTEAPAWRNCSPASAESIPPVARIGKPGMALAMADTALRAMGLMALPAHSVHMVQCWREASDEDLAQCAHHVSPSFIHWRTRITLVSFHVTNKCYS